MNDKFLETDFLYNIGDCVTFNFITTDEVTQFAIIIGRKFVESHKTYDVIWLDKLESTLGTLKYEYLENQIKKA